MRSPFPSPSHSIFAVLAVLVLMLTACGAPDKPTVSLYTALQRGDIDQLERHIYWGSDVEAVLPNGQTPLHQTALQGDIVMLKMLLKKGVEVDPRNASGYTPLELAILNGRTQAAEVLIEAGAAFEPSQLLLLAAEKNVTDRDVIRFLTQRGADVNTPGPEGNTPLLIAARHGNHRLIHHLVENGADVNQRNQAGESALNLVRQRGLPEVEKFLLRNGASG